MKAGSLLLLAGGAAALAYIFYRNKTFSDLENAIVNPTPAANIPTEIQNLYSVFSQMGVSYLLPTLPSADNQNFNFDALASLVQQYGSVQGAGLFSLWYFG